MEIHLLQTYCTFVSKTGMLYFCPNLANDVKRGISKWTIGIEYLLNSIQREGRSLCFEVGMLTKGFFRTRLLSVAEPMTTILHLKLAAVSVIYQFFSTWSPSEIFHPDGAISPRRWSAFRWRIQIWRCSRESAQKVVISTPSYLLHLNKKVLQYQHLCIQSLLDARACTSGPPQFLNTLVWEVVGLLKYSDSSYSTSWARGHFWFTTRSTVPGRGFPSFTNRRRSGLSWIYLCERSWAVYLYGRAYRFLHL